MAQTPHQQIQMVQQQHPQMAAPQQLQQVYFSQPQMLYPGNITLQQTGSSHGTTLQSILPNRSYSSMMPKPIQSSPVTVQSMGGTQRQLVPQLTNQTVGTFQPSFLSNGSFTTLGPLPVGYQWATSCYQPQQQQSPIIIRSPHPGIYFQSQPQPIQMPISAAPAPQMVTPSTSFTSSAPQIQMETQTISTQTLVPSVTTVNSNSYLQAPLQLDSNTAPSVTKSPPCNSPSSSTQDPQPPLAPSVPEASEPPAPPPTLVQPAVEAAAAPSAVSSTTTVAMETVAAQSSDSSDVRSDGGTADAESAADSVEETEQVECKVEAQPFSPQKSALERALMAPVPPKQLQKAIVKPQMVTQVKEEAPKAEGQVVVGSDGRGDYMQEGVGSHEESLKPLVSSPKAVAPPKEPVRNLLIPIATQNSMSSQKFRGSRGRGRPRRKHGRFKHSDLRRSSRAQPEMEGEVSKSSQASSSQSSSEAAEMLCSDTNPSVVLMDIMSVVEHKLKVDMPKTPPNTWTVDEVCDFICGFPGCRDYAESFRSQEIDGQALLLIQLDHLMTGMAMKLGPAVKLIAHIRSMKEQLS